MEISTPAFVPDGPIPTRYTGDGEDISPPLTWTQVPDGTQEFALICDDPDAPRELPWVHWVLFKIPGSWRVLPEGIGNHSAAELPNGLRQGLNSWPSGKLDCYRGPEPPRGHGVHHYHFQLHALDTRLELPNGISKEDLLRAIEGHVIAIADLVGTYER